MVVLDPQGVVAQKEFDLIIFTILLSLIVVIPVYVMTFVIARKYRAGNKHAKYEPDWDHSHLAETIWWVIPLILILILAAVTWKSSHDLDPFKPLSSSAKPLKIQVIALNWKWLFIYPEQGVASVNYVQFPQQVPVNFEITADAPMNSFWIPQLGSQIYAMSGMATHVNLMANNVGTYRGSSANISGRGFANMHFQAHSSTAPDFVRWVRAVQVDKNSLNMAQYEMLAKPSEDYPPSFYGSIDHNLFKNVMHKYTMPNAVSYEMSHD